MKTLKNLKYMRALLIEVWQHEPRPTGVQQLIEEIDNKILAVINTQMERN